jgi:hypothetical protein
MISKRPMGLAIGKLSQFISSYYIQLCRESLLTGTREHQIALYNVVRDIVEL